jgi:hypothetical protein
MILGKANEDSEAGVLPDEKMLSEMAKCTEELVKSGADIGREAPAKFEGRACPLRQRENHRNRRALRRDEGTGRRLLSHRGEIEG